MAGFEPARILATAYGVINCLSPLRGREQKRSGAKYVDIASQHLDHGEAKPREIGKRDHLVNEDTEPEGVAIHLDLDNRSVCAKGVDDL